MSRELVFGDIVKLHSLQGLKMLNGCVGTVLGVAPKESNPDGDRYEVHLKNQETTKMVRKTNLTPLFDTYRVAESKKAEGKGVFALRDIEAGEVILKEKSLLQLPEKKMIVEDQMKPEFKEAVKYLKGELDEADYALFSQLVGATDSDKILRNVFEPQAGILFVTAMINHSCAGNANYEYDDDEHCEVVSAIRPIKAGEEIFHSYVNMTEFPVKKDRQIELFIQKKFKCACELCSHKESDEIDSKLKELSFLYQTMLGFMKQSSYQKQVDVTTERMIELAQQLDSQYNLSAMKVMIPVFCDIAMRVAIRFQEADKISEWAKKYVESFPGTHPLTKYWNNKLKEQTSFAKNPQSALKKKKS